MTASGELNTSAGIASWIASHLTEGEGMRRPYKRKWENGGCIPAHTLGTRPSERVAALAGGLASLGRPLVGADNGIIVEIADRLVRVSADQSEPGDRPPQACLMQILGGPVNYVGNSPEVIIELLRGLRQPPSPRVDVDFIQIGFPGHEQDELTYVGSWEWNVHGEARGTEFVDRAAAATLVAIETARKD